MTFDGITTRAVVLELKEKLENGRINKINQPSDKTITISIYSKGENRTLYLSADPSQSSIYLTDRKFQNPTTPPNFCMLLRKHIGKSKLSEIYQYGLDRTLRLRFDTFNELGDPIYYDLICELMGKYSNIILLDMSGRVLDAVTRVSHDMSRVRQIFPGTNYEIFPSDKKDILIEDLDLNDLISPMSKDAQINKIFVKNLTGFSPIVAKELAFRSDLAADAPISQLSKDDIGRLAHNLANLVEDIRRGNFSPSLYTKDKKQFHALKLYHLGQADFSSPSISQVLDKFSQITIGDDRLGSQKHSLMDILSHYMSKQEKKLLKLKKEYELTLDRQNYKEEADLLSSNVHLIKRGMEEVSVEDFFNGEKTRTIFIDPGKSAWDNIQIKYKKFSKLNTTHKLLSDRIPKLEAYIDYLRQVYLTIKDCDSRESLDEIRSEMVEEGIVGKSGKKGSNNNSKAKKGQSSLPRTYVTENGFEVLVGKNNNQNDRLTLKIANKEDYFFHAKGIAGAHVILRCPDKEPELSDIEAAAYLAAKYSSQSDETRVDVDYTKKKNVYKAKGAKPGMVYYNDFSTITVNTKADPQIKQKD